MSSSLVGSEMCTRDSPRVLHPGDWLLIPAKQKHRVEWTDKSGATIWLAVHFS
ncbi:hypothetical protein MPC1_1180005 [Methylocella tundrae]|nr:hypothetical protein MPC1_1180005 [Methylocella tundrae]